MGSISIQEFGHTHDAWQAGHPNCQRTEYIDNTYGLRKSEEKCVGVVKAAKVLPKKPTQHYADLKILCKSYTS